jgi:hypothetical protein
MITPTLRKNTTAFQGYRRPLGQTEESVSQLAVSRFFRQTFEFSKSEI